MQTPVRSLVCNLLTLSHLRRRDQAPGEELGNEECDRACDSLSTQPSSSEHVATAVPHFTRRSSYDQTETATLRGEDSQRRRRS